MRDASFAGKRRAGLGGRQPETQGALAFGVVAVVRLRRSCLSPPIPLKGALSGHVT
jgi:hypothetical protein